MQAVGVDGRGGGGRLLHLCQRQGVPQGEGVQAGRGHTRGIILFLQHLFMTFKTNFVI